MKKMKKNFSNKGSVSIFIVAITCALVAIMAASFMRLMVRDQQQATQQDLSQSAYDSAQVGVEDAKRFLENFNTRCAGGNDTTNGECRRMADAMAKRECDTLASGGIGTAGAETKVQSSAGSSASRVDLNQAYTCVKITRDTADFLGSATEGTSRMIALRGTGAFNQVRISWHNKEDLTNKDNTNINLENESSPRPKTAVPSNKEWKNAINRPAILKTQVYGYRFNSDNDRLLERLNNNFSAGNSGVGGINGGTGLDEMLLYPASGIATSNTSRLPSTRREGDTTRTDRYTLTRCESNLDRGQEFACSMLIDLRHEQRPEDFAFLRLTPIYNKASFKIELLNNGKVVNFNGVQPSVDSTGRANDQFRRVQSRIEFSDPNFPVPDFSVQTEDQAKPVCKNFWVTNLRQSDKNSFDCK